mmetsp:Transcript_87982/g.247232  ORF Transcript_87982/g.247232 Transcript_87982/m.247232 type:complete len:209 (-) Transcript_87982:1271-1897(-)
MWHRHSPVPALHAQRRPERVAHLFRPRVGARLPSEIAALPLLENRIPLRLLLVAIEGEFHVGRRAARQELQANSSLELYRQDLNVGHVVPAQQDEASSFSQTIETKISMRRHPHVVPHPRGKVVRVCVRIQPPNGALHRRRPHGRIVPHAVGGSLRLSLRWAPVGFLLVQHDLVSIPAAAGDEAARQASGGTFALRLVTHQQSANQVI